MTHLNEEQFADSLIGLATPETQAHLLACAACRAEMESFGGSIAAFNRESLAWSREVAAAHPVHMEPAPARAKTRRPVWQNAWAAGLVAAALLVIAVTVPGMKEHSQSATATAFAPAAPAQPQAENNNEIAADNQMMEAIDAEISQPELSPVESFGDFRPQPGHDAARTDESRHAARKKS